jgi:ABC-2 type transport system permease protein
MRALVFAKRNIKELFRDPLNIFFATFFPIMILFIFAFIQKNVPESIFKLEVLTPGVAVFGLSFISLFSGVLISKDRTSLLFMRLFASPMTSKDFIIGYTLPLLPVALAQSIIVYGTAILLGLPLTINILTSVIVLIPTMFIFIAIGLIAGGLLTDKQVSGLCGGLLTNASGWLSGAWFDVKLIGGGFETVANLFPFVHSVNVARAVMDGTFNILSTSFIVTILYALVLMGLSIFIFKRKMKF